MLKPKLAPPPALKDRIEAIHKEIEDLIEKRAQELKAECPNQPLGVLKMMLEQGQCLCRVGQRLSQGD